MKDKRHERQKPEHLIKQRKLKTRDMKDKRHERQRHEKKKT